MSSLHGASSADTTSHVCDAHEVFSVLFLSCKANARVNLAKSGHRPHLLRIIVFCVVLVIVLRYRLYAVLLLLRGLEI